MRRLFIFDCFGVVLGEIAPVWFKNRFGSKGDTLKEKYFSGGDRGEKNISEILNDISHDLGIDKATIAEEWGQLVEIDYGLLEIIESLRKTDAVALLTNVASGLIEKLFDKFSLNGYFDKIFVSGDMKVAKPDALAYKTCVNSFDEEFSEIFMIDDNRKNLIGLGKLNITPVLYAGSKEFADYLRRI